MQLASYEGRDLLRIQDIQGAQSSTNVKYRNFGQEQYVPEVLRHVPDQYQRQAELHKSIRNPHYNDFRYDLNQQHPHFAATSLVTDYQDSLDNFKLTQEAQKKELIRNNSNINYDFIRGQKNKNTFSDLNPPFANLHSEISQTKHENLSSPLITYLKSTNSKSNNNIATHHQQQQQHPHHPGLDRVLAANSHNPSPRNTNQSAFLSHQSSQAKLATVPSSLPPQRYSQSPQIQSATNLVKIEQQQTQLPKHLNQNNLSMNTLVHQQPIEVSQSMYVDSPVNYMQSPGGMQRNLHNASPSNSLENTTSSVRKTYKPYNIISNNRNMPYTPKYDLPDVKWDKYDRQMFSQFNQKNQPPVEIIKGKNKQMNVFSDYSTWNQKYGEINS